LLANREAALRLATNRDIDRKLRTIVKSRFFWVYALSLWDPDAFWKCISGASAFAVVGLYLAGVAHGGFVPAQLTATVIFEYFVLGLILMWAYNLGAWLHPANFTIIFTLIFRLYRKNKTVEDLSAQELGRLFPEEDSKPDNFVIAAMSRLYLRVKRSPVLGSLIVGSLFAAMMVALLVLAS